MIAAVAVEGVDLAAEDEPFASDRETSPAPDDLDPLASMIARLNAEIERRDDVLDEPFTLFASRRVSVPLALCGTRVRAFGSEGRPASRRTDGDLRGREWRAELDAASSVPDGPASFELVYRLRWTSDWYRDLEPVRLAERTP